jgi:hypothetical protein
MTDVDASDAVHLVLLRTDRSQSEAFGANRLRLAMGGSELIHRVGRWALEAGIELPAGAATGLARPVWSRVAGLSTEWASTS